MKMYLISDNVDTLTGMRLAGIDGVVAHTKPELTDALEAVFQDSTIGILLLVENFSTKFPDVIYNFKLEHTTPLVVEIPDRHGTGRKPGFITDYINDAIGLKL